MSVPPSPMRHRQPSDDGMTRVELTWIEKRIEHWIRFGRVAVDEIVDRRRRVVRFRPGVIFAFVRWAANDYPHPFVRGKAVSSLRPARSQAGRGAQRRSGLP